MTQPRYQIFVSSTFHDLQEERLAVLNAILKLNQFPAGMEIFPAANETPWELIENIIADSDYYLLIIGGKYGSMDENGLGYTEKEYDFAISQKIPVLPFIHSHPESISVSKSEPSAKIRKKLDAFKKKISNHHFKTWSTTDELRSEVLASLSISFVTKPRAGWYKADGINKGELLERLATLQKKYDESVDENNKLKESALLLNLDEFVQEDDPIDIKYKLEGEIRKVSLTCNQIILGIGQTLMIPCEIYEVASTLGEFIWQTVKEADSLTDEEYEGPHPVTVQPKTVTEIENQLQLLGLLSVDSVVKQTSSRSLFNRDQYPTLSTSIDRAWQFTDRGRNLFLSQTALRRNPIK